MDLVQILDIVNPVLAAIGVAVATNLFFTRRKAEKKLYRSFYVHVKNLHKFEEMKKLRNSIVHGQEPNEELLKIYKNLIEESLIELEPSDVKAISNILMSDNEKAKYGFMAKFLKPMDESTLNGS
jgi:hypothetical protein